MKSNHMRGRSITNDSAVLSLFQSINNMHPQLLDILNQLDEKRRERLSFCLFSNDVTSKKCDVRGYVTSSLQVKALSKVLKNSFYFARKNKKLSCKHSL